MPKKFTDLTTAAQLTNADIFAIVDDAGNATSKKITAETISSYAFRTLTDPSVSTASASTGYIINAIQAKGRDVDSLGATIQVENQLEASKVYFGETYQLMKDILIYTNVDGAPDPITRNNELSNDMRFPSYIDTDGGKLQVINATFGSTSPIGTPITITTDMITDVGADNKYFDGTAVQSALDEQFPTLFNQYSNAFDGGDVKDSITNVRGRFLSLATGTTSNTLEIPIEHRDFFSLQKRIRVYGGSETNADFPEQPGIVTASSSGFRTKQGGDQFGLHLEYRIASFNIRTGKIGRRSNPSTVSSFNVTGTETSLEDITNEFSISKYVRLVMTKGDIEDGMLVYRRTALTSEPFKLVAILGPEELSATGGSWTDYWTFDYVDWSGKDSLDNSYLAPSGLETDLVHFPATLASSDVGTNRMQGWQDVTITGIVERGSTFEITIDQTLYTDGVAHPNKPGNFGYIWGNDTNTIETAISDKDRDSVGTKSIQFNAKTYNVSSLSIPDGFGLVGIPGVTKVRKLPWSSYPSTSSSNRFTPILRSKIPASCESISLVGIEFDGNLTNQFMLSSDSGLTANSFINFGTQPINVSIDNCKIRNMIGDGVFASSPIDLKITSSEIANSGHTDRLVGGRGRAPLQIDDGTNTMIIGNVVKNFTSPIDASVTKGGSVIANNVIKNCDSGLFLYGSTFVVSSPNVIMGPANEFISTVDVLNSEFDSVNILRSKMQQSLAHNDGYISDPLVYQENGETVDLTLDSVNSGTGNVIYRANLVMGYKSSADAPDGVEETFYGHEVGPGATDIGGTNWSLTTSSQNSLVTGKEYRITDLGNTNPVDWTRVGANVNKEGTTFIYNGSELKRKDGSSNPQSGKVSSFEFAGFVGENLVDIANVTGISSGAVSAVSHGLIAGNKVRITDTSETLADGDYIVSAANLGADAFTLTGLSGTATTSEELATVIVQKVEEDVWYDSISKDTAFKKYDNAEVDATDGQFQFHIIDPTLSRLVTGVYSRGALASLYTKKKKTSAVDTNSARIHPHNTHHIGVSWSANYRGKVKAGQIQTTGTWDATTTRLYNASTGLDHNGKNASLGTGDAASGDVTAIMNTNRRYRDFTCLITESNYIQVGSMVTIDGHSGFQIGRTLGATASSEPYGIVVAYEDTATANQKSLTVRYFGEESAVTYQNLIDSGVLEAGDVNSGNNIHPDYVNAGFTVNSSFAPYDVVNPANTTPADINGQTPGSTAENASFGTINIVDDYVLAQGLIK